ncbi:MAG: conjugative transfer signal peptidase TraF [Gammaproteobacteria bacterium]
MKTIAKRLTKSIVIFCILFMAIGAICIFAGLRINTTKSIPFGFYWITNTPIEKGAYVIFCPPKNSIFDEAKKRGYISVGFCQGNYGYMMKRVAAVKGDIVSISSEGVCVNGKLLPVSKPFIADAAGRPMFRHAPSVFTLGTSELLLMSDVSAVSFDSRYFGPINRSQIIGVIRPVWTWL